MRAIDKTAIAVSMAHLLMFVMIPPNGGTEGETEESPPPPAAYRYVVKRT